MMDYTLVQSDAALRSLIQRWNSEQVSSIAMDFEGEYNLHIYGEHLCLIQINDGSHYYLIDPFRVSKESIKELLESQYIEKIMFDCTSDAALVRKQYGITLTHVFDLRIAAQLLGFNGNLTKLMEAYLGIPSTTGKKGNQTANWLIRPLKQKLISYALSDVEHLFELKDALIRALEKQNLTERNRELQASAALPKGPDRPGWEKLPGYRYLSPEQRVYLRWFFEARDMLARKLNKPAFQVLDKRVLVSLAKNPPQSVEEFRVQAPHRSNDIERDLVALLMVARDGAVSELAESTRKS
jgi:ribonuclease D